MRNVLPILLILAVFVISGCTQQDTVKTPVGDFNTNDIGKEQPSSDKTTIESEPIGKWEKVGDRKIHPELVFNGKLYGYSIDTGAVKLQGEKWISVGNDKWTVPAIVHNNVLYGDGGDSTYFLSRDESKWVHIGDKEKKLEYRVIPIASLYNGQLYGYGSVNDNYGKAISSGLHKLENGKWVKSSIGDKDIFPDVVFDGVPYGHQSYVETEYPGAYKLEKNTWTKVGNELVNPKLIFNNGNGDELYGEWGGLADIVTYETNKAFKLNKNRDEWTRVGSKGVAPEIVFDGDLYGYELSDEGLFTYKLQGNDWVKVGKENVKPVVVFGNELYGKGSDDWTYKLVLDK